MNAGLFRLAFRRALAPAVLVLWALLLAVFLRYDWAGGSAGLPAAPDAAEAGALARGMAREGTWLAVALAILPLLVARAARIVPAWRAGEGDWIGSRAIGRPAVVLSTFLGTWAGAAVLLVASGAAIELRARGAGAGLARAGAIALPAATWIEPGAPLAAIAPDPGERFRPGSRARVELAFGSRSGAVCDVVLTARRAGSGAERSARARLVSRGAVEVELPPGAGDLRLEIACPDPGSRAYAVSDEIELWVPCASERAAGLRILARLLAASFAWIALALGLSAWISAPSAALAVLAAWTIAWLGDASPAWLPGGDLGSALATAGSGRVPPHADPRSLALALGLAALGLALAVLGTRRWRAAA
jgi:hypothetical protein